MLLSCQPRVRVTSCFVYKVIRALESIDHLCINPIRRIGLIHMWSIDSHLLKWSVQVNVLLNNCKQNTTSLSLLAGRIVLPFFLVVVSVGSLIPLSGSTRISLIVVESGTVVLISVRIELDFVGACVITISVVPGTSVLLCNTMPLSTDTTPCFVVVVDEYDESETLVCLTVVMFSWTISSVSGGNNGTFVVLAGLSVTVS